MRPAASGQDGRRRRAGSPLAAPAALVSGRLDLAGAPRRSSSPRSPPRWRSSRRRDNDSPTSTQVATGPSTEPAGHGAQRDDADRHGRRNRLRPAPTTEPVEPEPPPPGPGGLVEWPQGQTGWTIVLASLPESAGRAAATVRPGRRSQAGLTDVGVLNSSDYSSLHPGLLRRLQRDLQLAARGEERTRHRAGDLPAGVHAADNARRVNRGPRARGPPVPL